MKVIQTKKELQKLAIKLGVRPDWHEPDEQKITAEVRGKSFDNAGFYGFDVEKRWIKEFGNIDEVEQYVVLKKDGKSVAIVNLATLFAFATGTYEG